MLHRAGTAIFLLLLSFSLHALEAVVLHSVFYIADPIYNGRLNPYAEAYWQVNPRTVHFSTNENKGIIARIQMDILIVNDTGKVIKQDNYVFQTRPVASVDELGQLNILELKRYLVVPGFMKMTVKLTDLNDTASHFVAVDTFTVPRLPSVPFYGDIELIDTSYDSDVKSPFRKHGRQYIPLCLAFYDNYRSSISYYTELYYLPRVKPALFPLVQTVYISRKMGGEPMEGYLKTDTIRGPEFTFTADKIDISRLSSGNYYLNFVTRRKDSNVAVKATFFQRMNTVPKAEPAGPKTEDTPNDTATERINVVDLTKSFLAKYSTGQIMAILKMLLPVIDAAGVNTVEGFLKKPDDTYMRYFIYNHFKANNNQKPEIAWKEYTVRVEEANKQYSMRSKPGYETIRGYMFLRYGKPSEVVSQPHERGSLPYEIWQYNLLTDKQGRNMSNSIMLFYKKAETDLDFQMLHTNISGEVHNMAWRSFLYTATDASGKPENELSAAEQYIGNK